ncbi:MAG: hypothetical protein P8Y84_11035 [Desulfuromonadales bacterium]
MFVLFLAIFVLLGLLPAIRRTTAKWRQLMVDQKTRQQIMPTTSQQVLAKVHEVEQERLRLNDYEQLILRSVGRSGGRLVRLSKVVREMQFDKDVIRQAMTSLYRKGMIRILPTFLFGPFLSLTGKGRKYAVAHGLMPFFG